MRILMISGSVRKGSFNSKLVSLLAPLVEKGGATVKVTPVLPADIIGLYVLLPEVN